MFLFVKNFVKNILKFLIFSFLVVVCYYSVLENYYLIFTEKINHRNTYFNYDSKKYLLNFVNFFENIQHFVKKIPKICSILKKNYNLWVESFGNTVLSIVQFFLLLLIFIFKFNINLIILNLKKIIILFFKILVYIDLRFYNIFYFFNIRKFLFLIKIILFKLKYIIKYSLVFYFLFFKKLKTLIFLFFYFKFINLKLLKCGLQKNTIFSFLFFVKVYLQATAILFFKNFNKVIFTFFRLILKILKIIVEILTYLILFLKKLKFKNTKSKCIKKLQYSVFNFFKKFVDFNWFFINIFYFLFFFINSFFKKIVQYLLIFLVYFLKKIGLPFRIFIRFLNLCLCFSRAFAFLVLYDILIISKYLWFTLINLYFLEIIRRGIFYFLIFVYVLNYDKITITCAIQPDHYYNIFLKNFIFDIFESYNQPILISILFLFILVEIASLYYITSATKFIHYSIYYLFFYLLFIVLYIIPEYSSALSFMYKGGGFFILFLYTFRSLREDYRVKIPINSYFSENFCFTLTIPKQYSVIFKIFDKTLNVYVEHVIMYIYIFTISILLFDLRDSFYYSNTPYWAFNSISNFQTFLIAIYLIFLRQSTYAYSLWLLIFSYYIFWNVISIFLLSTTNYSYFGILAQNGINETNALGNTGLVSTISGLEQTLFDIKNTNIAWYFGENFYNNNLHYSIMSKNDNIFMTSTPFNPFGDMYVNPYLFTASDDHNWSIFETLEKNYFNSVKLEKSNSDSSSGDTEKFWPIERNLYIRFGEFLETDIYYGWSSFVNIDTQTFFDYSPYGLTNILGDSFMKNLLTDVFSIFSGPVELDESTLLNSSEWGSNYVPGSTTNRISGGMSSGLENSFMLNSEQKLRENGENYHEWFPGLYVLDGRFDSKFSYFYLNLFLILILPITIISLWLTVLGKKSNFFDETFGELEFTNYNFYFFGNEQSQTFTTYFWNDIYNTNYEWPSDEISLDPVAYEPTSNLFEEIFRHFQSGLFNYSVLDSYFYVPILKHTEGFSSESYKDFLMPLLFPTNIDSKSARIEDFNKFYENFKKIKNNTKNYKTRELNKEFSENHSNWNNVLKSRDIGISTIGDSWVTANSKTKPNMYKKYGYGDVINFTTVGKVINLKNKYNIGILGKFWLDRKFNNIQKNYTNLVNIKNNKNSSRFFNSLKTKKSSKLRSKSYKYIKKYNNFTNFGVTLVDDKSFDIKDLIFRMERKNSIFKWKEANGYYRKDYDATSMKSEEEFELRFLDNKKYKSRIFNNTDNKWLPGNSLDEFKKLKNGVKLPKQIKSYWHPAYENFTYNNKTKFENLNSFVEDIDLDLHAINTDGTPILANEIAFEHNFEYSNLFESIILELMSPDGQRHRDLEYEFLSSEPEFSTISEFADPEGNFNESGIFENDTIIDDPRTEMISEWEDSVENMDNILSFFLSNIQDTFWDDIPDEYQIFSLSPQNTNLQNNNVFKKRNSKNYTQTFQDSSNLGITDEESIGYGAGLVSNGEIIGASPDPDKNYEFADSDIKDGFFKYFLTTRKVLIKSGLKQAIKHKIQSIRYYGIKKVKVYLNHFFDEEKNDLDKLNDRLIRLHYIASSYIKYKFENDLFNSKIINKKIYYLYELKRQHNLEIPEHIRGYFGKIAISKKKILKLHLKDVGVNNTGSSLIKIFLIKKINPIFVNFRKHKKINKLKFLKYNSFKYFKILQFVFKKTNPNYKILLVNNKFFFNFFRPNNLMIINQIKNIFILWKYFLNLYKIYINLKKIFLNKYFIGLKNHSKPHFYSESFFSKNNNYFVFLQPKSFLFVKKVIITTKKEKLIFSKKIKKPYYYFFKKINNFFKNLKIIFKKNNIITKLSIVSYFRFFEKKPTTTRVTLNRINFFNLKSIKLLKIKKLFLIKNNLFIYKNPNSIFLVKTNNIGKTKNILIVKIMYNLYSTILKNKLKKNIFSKEWYSNLYPIFYLIVELISFSYGKAGIFENLKSFLYFYRYFVKTEGLKKKYIFNKKTINREIKNITLIENNNLIYFLISKFFFSNIVNYLDNVSYSHSFFFFFLININYLLKFLPRKNKYFKIFKINCSFLKIKKPTLTILQKIIKLKKTYGKFIPYNYSTILLIDNKKPGNTDLVNFEFYFNFYKIVKLYKYSIKIFNLFRILLKSISVFKSNVDSYFYFYLEKIEYFNINNLFFCISNLILKPLFLYFKNSNIKKAIKGKKNKTNHKHLNIKKQYTKSNIFKIKKKNNLKFNIFKKKKSQSLKFNICGINFNKYFVFRHLVPDFDLNNFDLNKWYSHEKKRLQTKYKYTMLADVAELKNLNNMYKNHSFNLEYSTIWIKELLWHAKQSVYQDPSSVSFGIFRKRLEYCLSGNFYDIVNLLPIRLKFRKYLKKKYNQFIYKSTTFLVGIKFAEMNYKLNELFFEDITEVFVKFLISKIIIFYNFKTVNYLSFNKFTNRTVRHSNRELKQKILISHIRWDRYINKNILFNVKKNWYNFIVSANSLLTFYMLSAKLSSKAKSYLGQYIKNFSSFSKTSLDLVETKSKIQFLLRTGWYRNQKFKNLKIWSKFPQISELRHFWTKTYVKYTTVPNGLVNIKDAVTLIFLQNSVKLLFLIRKDDSFGDLKKLIYIYKFKTKLDSSDVWYTQLMPVSYYIPKSLEFNIKFYKVEELALSLNLHKIYKSSIQKIFYLKKFWNLTKNYGNFGKLLLKNIFWLKLGSQKKKKSFNTFLYNQNSMPNLFYYLSSKKNLNIAKIKNTHKFIYHSDKGNFFLNNLKFFENFITVNISEYGLSSELLAYSQKYLSYFIFLKIIKLLNSGYLQSNTALFKFEKNSELFLYSSLKSKQDTLWVLSTYLKLHKILNFKKLKNNNYIDFLDWRSLLINHNLNNTVLKKNNNIFYPILLFGFGILRSHWNYIKRKLYKNNINFIKKYVLNIVYLAHYYWTPPQYVMDSLVFKKNTKNSYLVDLYNSEHTKDFILGVFENIFEYGIVSLDTRLFFNKILIYWKEKKNIILSFKDTLVNINFFPYLKFVPSIFYSFIFIYEKVQPISSEDLVYFLEYSKCFLYKINYFVKSKKINLLVICKKNLEYLVNLVNLKFICRFDWYILKRRGLVRINKTFRNVESQLINKNKNNYQYYIKNKPIFVKKNTIIGKSENFKVNNLKNNYDNIISESINYDVEDQHWAELEKDVQPLAGTSESSMTGFTNYIFSESFWKKRFIEYISVKYLNMMHDEFSISSKGNPFYFENQLNTLRSFGYNIPVFKNDKISATLANSYHNRIKYLNEKFFFDHDGQLKQSDWSDKDILVERIERKRARRSRKDRFAPEYKINIINRKYAYKKHSNIRLVKSKKKKRLFRKHRMELDSYSKRWNRKKDGYKTYYKKKRIKKRYIYYLKKKRLTKKIFKDLIKILKSKKNEIVIYDKSKLNKPDYLVDKSLFIKELQSYFGKKLKITKNKDWRFLDKLRLLSIKKPDILYLEKIPKPVNLVALNKKDKDVGKYFDRDQLFLDFENLLKSMHKGHFRNLIIFNKFNWFSFNKYKKQNIRNLNRFNKKFGEFLSVSLDYDRKFWKMYYKFISPADRKSKVFEIIKNRISDDSLNNFKNYWKFKNYNSLKSNNSTNMVIGFLNNKNLIPFNYFLKKTYKINKIKSRFLIKNLIDFKKSKIIDKFDKNKIFINNHILKLSLINTLLSIYNINGKTNENLHNSYYGAGYLKKVNLRYKNPMFIYTKKIRQKTKINVAADPTFVLADADQKALRDLLILGGLEGYKYMWLDNKFDKLKYHKKLGRRSASRQRKWVVFLKYRYSRIFKYFLRNAIKKRKNFWKNGGNLIFKLRGPLGKTYFRKNRKWHKFSEYRPLQTNKYNELYMVESEAPLILDDFDLTFHANYTVANRVWNFSDIFGLKFNYYLEMPMSTGSKSKIYVSKIQNQFFDSPTLTKEMIFRIFPFFLEGGWSGSDSGQTAVGSNSPVVDSKDPEYRTYSPIFGIYLLNFSRLNRDIKQLGWNFTENLINHDNIRRFFFLFVSDHDTQFYDDKVLHIHNFWLFWLEFFRHLFLNRWTLVYNYTNSDLSKNSDIKYPVGFIQDLYWFKYLVFSRFVKKQINIIKTQILYQKKYSGGTVITKLKNNSKIIKFLIFLTLVKNKKIKKFTNYKYSNQWYSRKVNFMLNFKYLKNFKNLEFVDLLNTKILTKKKKLISNYVESGGDNFPNINKYFSGYSKVNNSIIFSKNLSWRHSKVTNPVMTYYKPYNNTEVFDHYNEVLFEFDPELPMKRFTYNWFVYSDLGVSNPWDYESDSDSNMYKLRDYPARESVNFRNDYANIENRIAPELNFTNSFNWDEDNSIDNKKVINKLEDLRNSTRKDTNLKVNRNWFFSNHILDTSLILSAYTGNWLFFSDFEVDSQRTKKRNLKHGSKYRLNFNTELWWSRTELPNYNFRRVDGLEYDVDFGALDSDGEIFHLHKGILDLAHLPENLDVFETSLPLFERSLIDPESPALNEDGEFPEFDLNIEYNTEIFKRLNFSNKTNVYLPEKNNTGWTAEPNIVTTSEEWHTELEYFSEEYAGNNKKNLNNKFFDKKKKHSSFKFKTGSVDWSDSSFIRNLKSEIIQLEVSHNDRKNNYNFGSSLKIISDMKNSFDLNIVDIGDVVDVLSTKTLHPVTYSIEGIFSELIETKLDEAVEYSLLSGISYGDLFVNYKFFNKYKKLNWYYLDLISETQLNTLENSYGFDFDLLLYKYSNSYWKIILELDSNWNTAYSPNFPQIVDNSNNIDEYLPVWNYDPSIWEYHGFEYDCSPLTLKDDSKILLNSKIARFDLSLNWLAQKDLKDTGISINNLGWGGSNITEGLANHLPYDLLYGSDVDSDFEIYSELLFFKNLEDNMSDLDSNFSEEFLTSNTSTDEYPQQGWSPERAFSLVRNAYVGQDAKTEDFSDNEMKDDITAESVNGELVSNPQFNEGDPTIASLNNLEQDDGFSSVNGTQNSGMLGYSKAPLDYNSIPSQLYYNGSTDQLATKYALYGGYGPSISTGDANYDVESRDFSPEFGNSDIGSYIETQTDMVQVDVDSMVSDVGSQYYLSSESKTWKYLPDDPEIDPELLENDIISDELLIDLSTEDSQDINYTSFLGLNNSKSLLVTDSVWKTIYYDFLSTYDYNIEDVKLYEKYSPNNREPYFINKTLGEIGTFSTDFENNYFITNSNILSLKKKTSKINLIIENIRNFKKFQKYLKNRKNNSTVYLKNNKSIFENKKEYKYTTRNNLYFWPELKLNKILPIFVNFKKFNQTIDKKQNKYFNKYVYFHNSIRNSKTNIVRFSKLDFKHSVDKSVANLRYPHFFYKKSKNKIFFNKLGKVIASGKSKNILFFLDKSLPVKFIFYKRKLGKKVSGHWEISGVFQKPRLGPGIFPVKYSVYSKVSVSDGITNEIYFIIPTFIFMSMYLRSYKKVHQVSRNKRFRGYDYRIVLYLLDNYFKKTYKNTYEFKTYKRRYYTKFKPKSYLFKKYFNSKNLFFNKINKVFKDKNNIIHIKYNGLEASIINIKKQNKYNKNLTNKFLSKNSKKNNKSINLSFGNNFRFSDLLKKIKHKKYKGAYSNNPLWKPERLEAFKFSKYKYLKKTKPAITNNYDKIESYNYSVSNIQLASKRGGIGDSSHWSSGTEYLGEQFGSVFRPHNDLFNTETNSRRNNRFLYSPELETDHTDHYTGYDTDANPEIYTGSFEPYRLSSEMSILYKNIMSEKDDHLDEFYDDNSLPGIAFEQFSYIDWGFDTDHDQLNSDQNFLFSEQHTGDMQRDRSSESVYLDFIQNEYARELRQNPEEVGDWTVSDFYTEIYFKHEISEIPLSTNESELYSVDSSNSISDYILGMGNDSYLDEKTLHISEEDSSEYEDPVFHNYGSSPNYEFNLIDKIQTLLQFDANIKASPSPNTDIFNLSEFLSSKPYYNFNDYTDKAVFESKLIENSYNTEWGDYNKMELEDNSRETPSYFKQQKYLDAFFMESTLSDILLKININENLGVGFNFKKILLSVIKPVAFKFVLFNKTNYLKNYRSLMLDLNLSDYMF